MKNASRKIRGLLPLVLIALTLSACGGISGGYPQDPAPAPVQKGVAPPAGKIKVGLLLPLSGQNKALGQAMLNAAQMALFDINAENFELVPRDTKSTAPGAAQAAREALSSGAKLLLGPIYAADVRAVKPIAESANVNMIAFSTDWTLAGGHSYIMGFLPFDQVERLTGFAAASGIKQVGLLSPASAYGRAVGNAFMNAARQKGVSITSSASFSDLNLVPIVNGFTQKPAPQAVLMPVGGTQAQSVAQILSASGMPPARVKRLGTGLFDDAALARDQNLQGAWFAAPSPNMRARFEQRYATTYGAPPPRLATLAYDATALAAVLGKRGHETGLGRPAYDRASLINPNGFSGIDGIFRFRADGTAERGLALLEVKNGQITVIDEAPKTFETVVSSR